MAILLFVPFAGESGGGSGPLETDLDLYVAPLTGDDENSGLTPEEPLETLGAAYAAALDASNGDLAAVVRIHLAQGTNLPMAPCPGFKCVSENAQVIVICDGADQGVEDGFVVVASGAAEADTSSTVLKFASASVDLRQGLTLEITSGPALGQRRIIRNNSTTDIVPDHSITGLVAGATFRILRPSASFLIEDPERLAAASLDYLTLINIGFAGGGSEEPLVISDLPCLKMYGCIFNTEAQISVNNSELYAGLTTTSTNVIPADIHFDELQDAMLDSPIDFGDPASWTGWGIATSDSHLNTGGHSLQNFTGYMVSRGQLTIGISPVSDYGITLLGGFVGGLLTQAPGTVEVHQASAIPTLIRKTPEVQSALAVFATDLMVQGGDLALELDLAEISEGLENGLHLQAGSNVVWAGPMSLSVAVGSAVLNDGSTLNVYLADTDVTLEVAQAGVGLATIRGGYTEIRVEGGGSGVVNIFSDGTTGFGIVAARAGTFRSLAQLNATGNEGDLDLLGIQARELSNIELGEYIANACTLTVSCSGLSKVLVANLSGGPNIGGAIVTDGGMLSCGQGGLGVVQQGLVAAVNASVNAELSLVLIGAGSGEPLVTVAQNSQVTLAGTNFDSDEGALGFFVTGNSRLWLSGDVTGENPCLFVEHNASVQFDGSLTASAATAVVISMGGQVSFEDVTAINAGGDGVDCSGGGRAYFQDDSIVWAVTGDELVVSAADAGSFATELPAAGSTFANTGGGSSMTRNT